ncbi:hypothetical protein OG304_06760 [Streptomyces sp. NBC_00160]|uniref:hypothetical protein n=1 Tax=Streptomyces sp. NBC_00160 TaxID=2903628 RepID=UPI0022560B6F|nr:hypothetical protein [Streptomyces sp. NBC_00160]MCX5303153.1 hypothetical protein [Streptomyces sp. NBC_00160]
MTTPLRERGLTCDVDYGLDDWIVYAWPPDHDAVFIIGSDDGWLVTYEAPAEDRSSITVLYDSRPQPDPDASTHIAHLITAVESHLTHLPRRSPPKRPASQPMATKTTQLSHSPVKPTPDLIPRAASSQARPVPAPLPPTQPVSATSAAPKRR